MARRLRISSGTTHTTILRHLRDVVITEYGIADLRGRTDQEVIAALLNVADSRFQDELLAQAKAACKISAELSHSRWNIGATRLSGWSRRFAKHRGGGFFSEYPFGTDLTDDEIVLARALKSLQARTATTAGKLRELLGALLQRCAT